DGESAKVGAFLGEVADAAAGALVHREVGDVVGVKGDGAAVGANHAHDHAEGGGLAGAVAAEDADDFLLGENEADLINNGAPAVSFDELCSFEKVHEVTCGGGTEVNPGLSFKSKMCD